MGAFLTDNRRRMKQKSFLANVCLLANFDKVIQHEKLDSYQASSTPHDHFYNQATWYRPEVGYSLSMLITWRCIFDSMSISLNVKVKPFPLCIWLSHNFKPTSAKDSIQPCQHTQVAEIMNEELDLVILPIILIAGLTVTICTRAVSNVSTRKRVLFLRMCSWSI